MAVFYIVKFSDSKQIIQGFKNLANKETKTPFKRESDAVQGAPVLARWASKWWAGTLEVISEKKPFLSKKDQRIKSPTEINKDEKVFVCLFFLSFFFFFSFVDGFSYPLVVLLEKEQATPEADRRREEQPRFGAHDEIDPGEKDDAFFKAVE